MKLSTYSRRVVDFNGALWKSRISFGSSAGFSDMEKLALSHVQWFNEHGKEELKHFMVNLDAQQIVTDNRESNKLIYDGIYSIMSSICSKIAVINPKLSGTLVKMGSAQNHMKINKLDEFDFTYEIDICTVLNNNAKIETMEPDQFRMSILIDFDGGASVDVSVFDIDVYPDDPFLDEILSENGRTDAERYKHLLSKHGKFYILNTEVLGLAIFNVLDSVIPTLELPEHWSHGGYNYPDYTGVRFNIPAFLMQFVYHSTDTPLHISVDFAPILKLPNNCRVKTYDLVDEFLENCGFAKYQWQRLECGVAKGGYNSLAEEKWLASYAANSVPKTVIRVCKALQNMLKLSMPKYLSRVTAEHVKHYRKVRSQAQENLDGDIEFPRVFLEYHSGELGQVKSDNDFATSLDIHETIGANEYISSYIFKRIVMTLMVIDSSNGTLWTLDDLPGLVLSVFMIVNDLIMSANQATLVFNQSSKTKDDEGNVTLKISTQPRSLCPQIQRPELPEILEQLEISIDKYKSKNLDTIIYKRSTEKLQLSDSLKWYFILHEAIREGKCQLITCLFMREKFCRKPKIKGLDNGIARVFDFLWSITAGESRSLINVYKYPKFEDQINNIDEYLITRKELNALLNS